MESEGGDRIRPGGELKSEETDGSERMRRLKREEQKAWLKPT